MNIEDNNVSVLNLVELTLKEQERILWRKIQAKKV